MRSWFWAGVVWAVVALAVPAGPLFAADPPHKGDGHSAKEKIVGVEKGLFKGAIEVSLWTILVFVLLFTVLRAYAWGPIRDGLDKRERSIAHDKEEAVKAKQEADELRKQLQAEMAKAQDEVRQMMDKARADAAQTAADELARGKQALAEERDRLRKELQISTDDALTKIWQSSAQLATLISTKVIHKQLSYDDHRALVNEALAEFRQSAQGRKDQLESARA